MAEGAHASGHVTLAEESPLGDEARVLIDEMNAFTVALYPEDEALGIIPSTAEAIARDGVFVVARVDGQAVATGALIPIADEPDAMEVKRMFVREGLRGRRLGGRVLNALEDSARERGFARLLLLTGPRQPDAIRLYCRAGFRKRGPFGDHIADPLCIYFEKDVAA